ncbi:stalk domain-containing protein [Paenibacillus silvisoli]|uniref:stalk domain-containing protein n=1 Tax=Paenibacillus silvisoli TaxID=3110539 RepID=UPI0028053398|nr:trypsin-like peptidase domain-containing protein [Paenibacillus silvisoli]
MRKSIISIITLLLILFCMNHVTEAAAVNKSVFFKVYLDGQLVSSNAIVKNGSTLVPFKSLLTAMGFQIDYDPKAKTITATKSGKSIRLTIGAKRALLNGEIKVIPVAPEIISSTTYIPLRFVGESMKCKLEVDSPAKTIYVDSPVIQSVDPAPTPEPTPVTTTPSQPTGELTTKQITALNDKNVVMVEMGNAQGSAVSLGNGLFMTNRHVVEDETSGFIRDINNNTYGIGGVATYSNDVDLAIIKLKQNTSAFDSVTLGNPNALEKGDKVVAIGSPRGVRNTVSEGVVSNIFTEDYVDYIQISVPIDHGSSGGGLFNTKGELVGITSAGIDDSNADLNFAISIGEANSMISSVIGKSFDQIPTMPFPASKQEQNTTPVNVGGNQPAGDPRQMIEAGLDATVTYIPTSAGNLQIGDWTSTILDDGTIFVFSQIYAGSYSTYLENYFYIEGQVEYWARQMGEVFAENFPNQKIEIAIYYSGIFSFYPDAFPAEDIKYVGNGYEVTHVIIYADSTYGNVQIDVRL